MIFPQGCSPASQSEEKAKATQLQRICSHPRVPRGEGSGSASRTQLEKEATGSRQSPRLVPDLGSYPGVSAYSPASSPTQGWVGGTSRKELCHNCHSAPRPRRGRFREEGREEILLAHLQQHGPFAVIFLFWYKVPLHPVASTERRWHLLKGWF